MYERIPTEYDRRRKLSGDQRQQIINKLSEGRSIRSLAAEYGVSRRAILLIQRPELRQSDTERMRRWRESHKTSTEDATRIQREHRAYKRMLKEKGLM